MKLFTHRQSGFTLVEVVVASALSTIFFTSAALVYRSISYHQKRLLTTVEIDIPSVPDTLSVDTLKNFFPITYASGGRTDIVTYVAPSYGRAGMASQMYDRFWEDIESASAAFSLARYNALNGIRPTSIPLGSIDSPHELDTPLKFRDLLATVDSLALSIYKPQRNQGYFPPTITGGEALDPKHLGATVYVMQPHPDPTALGVKSIYEIDLVRTSSPEGVYAAVRRYVGSVISDQYDVFYENAKITQFGPIFINFEKSTRLNLPETNADPYKKAKDHPFFFMWWPDPALMLKSNPESPAGDAMNAYLQMGSRTAFMFTVPMFPPL